MLFSEIVGQEKAKKFLKQVMAREKMPHAYLFTGIPGVGKTSTAMALATALNCASPVNGQGCGNCPSCRQMTGGNSPDFLIIKPRPDKKNILIEQIRDELNRRLGFAPLGRYRVCVICKAETMTEEASNSFLKTLEEPPPGNILILNTVEPRNLLPTIVSRCQRVSFQPLPVQDMANWIVQKRKVNEETAMVAARISGGSLGYSLEMCDSNFFEKRQEWLVRLINLPGLSRDKGFETAAKCADEAKKMGLNTSENGETGLLDMLSVWGTWYRDLLLVKSGGPGHLLINADFSHKLKNVAGNFIIQNLIDSILAVDQAQQDLRRNRNRTLVMEHVVLGLRRLASARGA